MLNSFAIFAIISRLMDFQQTLDYLFSALPMYQRIGKSAYKKNLDNTLALCEALGNPQTQFKSVHIAGTNGKGSSAHMISAILQSAGYKTGLYTSPHLKSFTERIRINGIEILEQAVIDFVMDHKHLIEEIKPSFFEITVVMAFEYFARQKVDIAVIEVGLGGRLDSTNVITPEVSLITNISLDHQEMLGDTLPLIAIEKAGIIKEGVPIVIGQRQIEIEDIFINRASALNSPIVFGEDQFPIDENNFDLQLRGDYQQNNLPGVLSIVDHLVKKGYKITHDHIQNGLINTSDLTGLKGRWQILQEDPAMICDTGHNVAGIQLILKQLSRMAYNQLHIVWGMVDDKDSESVLSLLPNEAKYYFCQANVPRAKKAQLLFEEANIMGLDGVLIEDVNESINAASQNADKSDLIFIGGSTFVVAEIANL